MHKYDIIAAVDLGSNSFRLQVARVEDYQIYPLDSLKEKRTEKYQVLHHHMLMQDLVPMGTMVPMGTNGTMIFFRRVLLMGTRSAPRQTRPTACGCKPGFAVIRSSCDILIALLSLP